MPHHALQVPPPVVPVPLERQIAAVERALCIEDGVLNRKEQRGQIHPVRAAIVRAELRAAIQTLRTLASMACAANQPDHSDDAHLHTDE